MDKIHYECDCDHTAKCLSNKFVFVSKFWFNFSLGKFWKNKKERAENVLIEVILPILMTSAK